MKRITHILILILFCGTYTWGQELTYKEIKTIEKNIDCTSKDEISITGERTFLNLSTWKKNYISAKINVISKHTDKSQATKDLEKINVIFEKDGKKIIYSNALRIKSPADKPKSHLSVTVDLIIPEHLKVDMTNAFGELEVSGVYDGIDSQTDFTAISISNYSGKAHFKTKYGDISIDGFDGELSIDADRSNLIMEGVTGKTEVEASYGELDIYYPKKSAFYKVNTAYSPISLYILEDFEEAIAITCQECSVSGNDIPLLRIDSQEDETNALISKTKKAKPTSLISSKIENVRVRMYNSKSKNN